MPILLPLQSAFSPLASRRTTVASRPTSTDILQSLFLVRHSTGTISLWGQNGFGREYITLDEESFPGAAIPIAELSAPLPDVAPFVQPNS
jgi:hypothetical protein